jgi:phosphate:Na+ symporter
MMGANIGTTITGWVISLLGFGVKLDAYSIPLFAIGVPMLLSKSDKRKYWGEFIIGFAILFLGLGFLKASIPDLDEQAFEFFKSWSNYGIFSRILFVLLGALVTIVVQSSSASMLITLAMVHAGWLPLDVAAAMVLGENIGTTITAEIASLIGNTQAKRSARIHSLFNVIGVIWMIILLPFVIEFLSHLVETFSTFFDSLFASNSKLTGEEVDGSNKMSTYTLAAFHTTFNVLNVILLIGFVPWLVKMAIKTVPEKSGEDSSDNLKFLNPANQTPELATVELQQEIARFGQITTKMLGLSKKLLNSTDPEEQVALIQRIKKYEETTDTFEVEITEYITAISDKEMTHKTSIVLRNYINICNDMERIGDIFYQFAKTMESKINRKIYFLPTQRNQLNELFEILARTFDEMNDNLSRTNFEDVTLDKCYQLEDEINNQRNAMRDYNQKNLGKKKYDVNAAMIFTNMFSSLERIGDHIVNVNESVIGEI